MISIYKNESILEKKKLLVFDRVKMDPRLRYLWKYFIVHSNKLTILLHVPSQSKLGVGTPNGPPLANYCQLS